MRTLDNPHGRAHTRQRMGGVPSPGFLGEDRGTGAATHPRAALTATGAPPSYSGAAGLPQPAAPAPRRPWTPEERAAYNRAWGAKWGTISHVDSLKRKRLAALQERTTL